MGVDGIGYAPEASVIEEEPDYVPEPPQPVEAAWSCRYSPSVNEDWHDDVVCSNGLEGHRPYLREWDSFVTEAEIMESAAEYEALLNAG
jgi:hypothetical protein